MNTFEINYTRRVISESKVQNRSLCETAGSLFLHLTYFSAHFYPLFMVKTKAFFMSLFL